MEVSILAIIAVVLGGFLSAFVKLFPKTSHSLSFKKNKQRGKESNGFISIRPDSVIAGRGEIASQKDKKLLINYKSTRSGISVDRLLSRVEFDDKFKKGSGKRILFGFLILVLVLGVLTFVLYWKIIISNVEALLYFSWLFLTMIAGMFVQVISSNYRNGNELFDVTASQLIFPILFSLIVFYPIWSMGASSPQNLFSFYAAFLNGFFWETVVSSTKVSTASG